MSSLCPAGSTPAGRTKASKIKVGGKLLGGQHDEPGNQHAEALLASATN